MTPKLNPAFAPFLLAAALALPSLSLRAADNTASPASTLYQMAADSVQTRSFTAENPKGLKGQAGQARFGRKGAPSVGIAAGKTLVLAEIQGSGTIHRIWGTLWQFTPEA